MHWISDPMRDRVVKATSGDTFYFHLPAGSDTRLRWSATCADPDVEVSVSHEGDRDAVRMHVHRGFDGPSTVLFKATQSSGTPPKSFRYALYKRTGDEAFWE